MLDGTDGTQEVEVRIVDAAFFFLRFVNGEVYYHATADKMLDEELSGLEIGKWTKPNGGYFVSFDALNGCAKKIVGI